jgi:Flp pilus assembly pilin Flp
MFAEGIASYHRTMMDRVVASVVSVQTGWFAFRQKERGASMVEYAIMISMIAIVAVVAVTYFGSELSNEYDTIADSVANYGRP